MLSSLAWQGMTHRVRQHGFPIFCATMHYKTCNNCSYTFEALLAAALLIEMYASSVTVSLSIFSVIAVG